MINGDFSENDLLMKDLLLDRQTTVKEIIFDRTCDKCLISGKDVKDRVKELMKTDKYGALCEQCYKEERK